MSINYYKCKGDCLEVVAVEGTLEHDDRCSVCGGRFKHMGQVRQNNLVTTQELNACNHSCTHAAGPICDCRCHSANHGTGRVVQREVVNGVPRVPSYDIEKATARMREYRPLRKEIERKVEAFKWAAGYDSGMRIYSFRTKCWRVLDSYKKLKALSSHFHRMRNGKQLLNMMEDVVSVQLPKIMVYADVERSRYWSVAGVETFLTKYNQREV